MQMKELKNIEIKKILVVAGFPGLGDLMVAVPVMRALKETFPEAKVYLTLRNKKNQLEILKNNPYIDKIIIFDKKAKSPQILKSLKLLKEWKKECFDVIVILHHARRYALLSWLAGGKIRLGYNTKGWCFFLNNVYQADPFKHETENLLEVIKPLGVKTENMALELWLEGQEREKIAGWLEGKNILNFIVIHPSGGWWGRRWPKENYAKLADYFIGNFPVQIVFTGNSAEKRDIEEIISLMREKAFMACGEFTVRELACLYEKALLFIGTDTGAMHIASAVNLPSLVMFGPQDPRRWKARNESSKIIYKHLDCSPCPQRCRRGRNICMEKISVKDIITLAGEMIKELKPKSS